jgi:hypothetical protein
MSSPIKSEYIPKNPEKYVGNKNKPIICRSSWERTFCITLDTHPNILSWASEPVSIPYWNPFAKRWSMYIPDFIITYVDTANKQHCEMIEIKPWKEDPRNPAVMTGSPKNKARLQLVQAINALKWKAGMLFCKKRGIHFRIMTEKDLFGSVRR